MTPSPVSAGAGMLSAIQKIENRRGQNVPKPDMHTFHQTLQLSSSLRKVALSRKRNRAAFAPLTIIYVGMLG